MRASDDRRNRTVDQLGQRFAEGYLSTDTFESRAVLAYASREDHELEALLDDLPPARSWRAALDRLRRGLTRVRPAGWRSDPVVIAEPPHDAAVNGLVIGRNPNCNLVLAPPTVSRRH